MLKIRSLYKSYEKEVISDFSFDFPEKGFFVIRGRSGVGKTTLLRIIAGLEKPDSGTIETNGGKVSVVFQEDRLLPFLTLLDNVLLVRREKDLSLAEDLLQRFGLLEETNKFPHELSGGMRLRGAIVRSLYYGGDIYLWDEPTKELDPENRKLVLETLQELANQALVIVVTHDKELVGEKEIFLS